MGLHIISQSFLQWLMAEKVLTTAEAVKRFNRCVEDANGREAAKLRNREGLAHRVTKINSQLEFAELQIKNMYSPWDDETYWGLCNTIGDEASRLGTHLDKAEVGVCFNILKELQDLEGGEMSLVEAQNVSTERDLPVAEVGRIIQKLHQLHWLRIARRDGEVKLTPGPRAIIELPQVRQWTRDVGREKRMKERELALNRVKKDEDEYEEEQAGRGRKRRSSQAEADEREQEIEQEIEEEIVPARSRGRPRAVRRGGRRSSRR